MRTVGIARTFALMNGVHPHYLAIWGDPRTVEKWREYWQREEEEASKRLLDMMSSYPRSMWCAKTAMQIFRERRRAPKRPR